ncbi:MAG TPA: hypothetical protein PKE16_06385 [Hyphomicrobium sp.]|nr:hypothetical protein [Hyphomicrobium sp.]
MTVSPLRLRLIWLTLFAFGVQIAVADFHHHITRGTGLEARALTAGMCQPSHDRPCLPLQRDRDGCVLCWAAAIAATSLTPLLVHAPTPSVVVGVRLRSVEPPDVSVARLADVRVRGPPRVAVG